MIVAHLTSKSGPRKTFGRDVDYGENVGRELIMHLEATAEMEERLVCRVPAGAPVEEGGRYGVAETSKSVFDLSGWTMPPGGEVGAHVDKRPSASVAASGRGQRRA